MENEMFVETDKAARAAEDDEEDDEDWSDLQRFQNFIASQHPLRRLVCVRGLEETVRALPVNDAIEGVLKLLDQACEDDESSVRDALAAQLAPALKDLLPRALPDEVSKLVQAVWPLSLALLKDKDQQVRAVAEDGVIEYAPLLPRNLLESPILESVLEMSRQDAEDQRITSMKLLGEFSFALGPELVMRRVAPEVVSLAGDSMFRVRKAAALYIGKICRWSPKGFAVSDLLPIYLQLAEDEIWGVRKACAEALPDVAASLPPEARIDKVLPLFDALATDVSRWVRNSAFQHLGSLIANLSGEEVSPRLLQFYSSMASGKGAGGASDNEMPHFCAYNFPAVVLTVGRENWGQLEGAYHELIKDIQWKVRRTLSYSLHEIAMILGAELTQQSLLPALDVFLKDLDEVKIGVLQNLTKFLAVLDPRVRSNYVSLLCSLEMESDNWRFRQILAQQLGDLFELYDDEVLEAELYPMFLKLCRDPVAEVRRSASNQLPQILLRLHELKVSWRDEFMEELGDLATDRVFLCRLIYVCMCEKLVAAEERFFDPKAFEKDFLPHLSKLSKDRVRNIRQRVAECFTKLKQKPAFRQNAEVQLCLDSLEGDTEVDVLRVCGKEIGIGMTANKYNGRLTGASLDTTLREKGEKM